MYAFEEPDLGTLRTPIDLNGFNLRACGRAGRMHMESRKHMKAHRIMTGPDDAIHIAVMMMGMLVTPMMAITFMMLRVIDDDEE